MVDSEERDAVFKEAIIYYLNQSHRVMMPVASKFNAWWPWVKNYWGEPGSVVADPPTAQMWIDQNLKAEMGY